MWDIERKESLSSKVFSIVTKRLLDRWYIDSKDNFQIIEIKNNIFAFKNLKTKNIQWYYNEKWEVIFFVFWLKKDLWVENYKKLLKKLWYKEIKDNTWYYHMINIKTKEETPQESLEYYKIFETLAFIDSRNIVRKLLIPADKFKTFLKTWEAYKYIADLLEDKDKENNLLNLPLNTHWISPLEYFSYLNLWLVEKQDILRYTEQVFNLDYFEKYYNNKWFELLEDKKFKILLWEWKGKYDGERILFERYKIYEISLKPSIEKINLILEKVLPFVEKLELVNTKNKEEQEKTKQRYEELREFLKKEKEKLEEKSKSRKKFASLEDDVKENQA